MGDGEGFFKEPKALEVRMPEPERVGGELIVHEPRYKPVIAFILIVFLAAVAFSCLGLILFGIQNA